MPTIAGRFCKATFVRVLLEESSTTLQLAEPFKATQLLMRLQPYERANCVNDRATPARVHSWKFYLLLRAVHSQLGRQSVPAQSRC